MIHDKSYQHKNIRKTRDMTHLFRNGRKRYCMAVVSLCLKTRY